MSNQVAVLQGIVQDLEQDAQIIRIKKLLLLSCTGHWESDSQKIGLLDTTRLIHRLRGLSPEMDVLERRLRQAAAYLNKPMVYDAIATTLIHKCAQLYQQAPPAPAAPAPPRMPASHDNNESTQLSFHAPPSADLAAAAPPVSQGARNLRSYNWFEVRSEVMRVTNPMRAKVLVFFTLEPQNNFNAYTWASIKSELLDRLLYRLCERCPEQPLLEDRLKKTVSRFPEADEYAQTAKGMVRVLNRLIYTAGQVSHNPTPELEAFGATGHTPDFQTFDTDVPSVFIDPDEGDLQGEEHSMFVMDDAFSQSSF